MVADPSGDLYAQAQAARKQAQVLAGQLQAAQREVKETWQLIRDSWEQAGRARAARLAAQADPERLWYQAYARQASGPVVEQAKGIIMAQYGWPEEQAFQALRQVSRREKIKVADLAASIVARAVHQAPVQQRAGHAPAAAPSDGKSLPRSGTGRPQDRRQASA